MESFYTPETRRPRGGTISWDLLSIDDFDDWMDTVAYPIRAWTNEDGEFFYINPLYN